MRGMAAEARNLTGFPSISIVLQRLIAYTSSTIAGSGRSVGLIDRVIPGGIDSVGGVVASLGFHIAAGKRAGLDRERFGLHLAGLLVGLGLDLRAGRRTVVQD